MDGSQALEPRQRVLHRLRPRQAHRVLRHAARRACRRDEIEAVLAHELGHFKLKHVAEAHRVVGDRCRSRSSRCSRGSRRRPGSTGPRRAAARHATGPASRSSLFFLVLPVFTFLLAPLASWYSRRHEFEADAFAAQHASAAALVSGAGQAVRGQRLDADARSAALGVLRLAPAGGAARRAAAGHGSGPRHERLRARCRGIVAGRRSPRASRRRSSRAVAAMRRANPDAGATLAREGLRRLPRAQVRRRRDARSTRARAQGDGLPSSSLSQVAAVQHRARPAATSPKTRRTSPPT